jgi:hypothetical protein
VDRVRIRDFRGIDISTYQSSNDTGNSVPHSGVLGVALLVDRRPVGDNTSDSVPHGSVLSVALLVDRGRVVVGDGGNEGRSEGVHCKGSVECRFGVG